MAMLAVKTGGVAALLLVAAAAGATEMPLTATQSATLALPTDGVVSIDRTWGEISVQAWNKPSVEVKMSLRTKKAYEQDDAQDALAKLQQFRFEATKPAANRIAINGISPDSSLLRPFGGKSGVSIHYAIRMPATASLTLNHQVGQVSVNGLAADVDVKNDVGEISLRLPMGADVAVESSSRVGDAELQASLRDRGTYKRRALVGHSFRYTPASPRHHVAAHVGVGSVSIH